MKAKIHIDEITQEFMCGVRVTDPRYQEFCVSVGLTPSVYIDTDGIKVEGYWRPILEERTNCRLFEAIFDGWTIDTELLKAMYPDLSPVEVALLETPDDLESWLSKAEGVLLDMFESHECLYKYIEAA